VQDLPVSTVSSVPAAVALPWRRALGGLGIVLLAAAVWVRWWGVPWLGQDLRVYLAGAAAAVGHTDLYAVAVDDGHGGVLRFTYPPFAALAFVPLRWCGAAVGGVLASASFAAYAISGAVCGRALGWSSRRTAALLVVGLVLEPVQRTLLFGQVNLLLMALVLVDAFVVPVRWRGWLTGVAAGTKLTPGVFVLYYLVRRDWASAARMGVSFAVTVAVGWVLLPADSARYWLGGLSSMSQFGPEIELWGNQSVGAVVSRAAQLHDVSATALHGVTYLLCALVMVLAVVAARAQVLAGDRVAALVVVGISGLLVSPVSWTHHWVWAVPALALVVERRWWVLAAVSVALFFLPPMWVLHDRPADQLGYTGAELAASAAFVVWAVGLLVVLLVDGLVARRRGRADLADAAGDKRGGTIVHRAPERVCDDSGGKPYAPLGRG
jgi:alpha-1,2-mannosyltransferase